MSQFVRLLQNGFMDKDTDLQLVSGGNYIDGQNIRHRDDSGANMTGVSPVLGNALKVTIPNPTTTVTSWRVYVKAASPYSFDGSISIINGFGTVLGPSSFAGSFVSTSLTISSINTVTDQIVFGAAHGLSNGNLVNYFNPFGSLAAPLLNGGSYFVKVINATTIELYTDAALTVKINITSAGSGTQSISLAPIGALVSQIQSMITGLAAGFSYSPFVYMTTETGYFNVTNSSMNDFEILETGNVIDYVVQTSEYVDFLVSPPPSFKVIGMESVGTDTIVFSVTSNSLTSSYYTPYTSLCEIGVIQYNTATDSYTYTRLLRSKQLNFNVDNQIQAQVEKRTQDVNIYWTDGVNKPRALSIPYPYVQDGVLSSNGGSIDISKVDKETTLFVDTPSATISFDGFVEGGGSLSCGNKRYTGRFVTDDFVGTDYLYPTGPINLFKAVVNIPSEIKGDQPGTLTNKSVKLTINNIPPGEFAYFELVAIEYEGETFTARMVQRYRLNNEVTLQVVHSNNGQDNFMLSLPELLALTAKVTRVQSLRVNSNRLFLANIDELVDKDLTLWAQSITHSIETKQVRSVGRGNRFGKNDTNKAFPNYRLGEYQDPNNVLNYTGYMINDTYRFGIQVQWKETGKWSAPYWVDDIRFDILSSNVTTPSRRSANNITTTNITDIDSEFINVYYPKFGNIDLNYVVDGVPLYKLIKAFRIVRADRIPEVLATGLLISGVKENTGGTKLIPYHKDISHSAFTFSQWPQAFCRRDRNNNFDTTTYIDNIQLSNAGYSNYGYFHSPDIYFNQADYTYQAGDILKVLSVPIPYDEYTLQGFSKGDYESVHQEYTGYFDNAFRNYTDVSILDAKNFETGEISTWDIFDKVKNGVSVPPEGVTIIGVNPFFSNMKACTVFKLASSMNSSFPGEVGLFASGSGTYAKEGLVYCQIFRNKGNTLKYPANKNQTVYESTGHVYILTGNERGVLNGVSVFGGDIFTQKSHLKIRMTTKNDLNNGFGLGYSFYSHNITNTQMFYTLDHNLEDAGPGYAYPQYIDKYSTGLNSSTYKIGGQAAIRDWSPTFSNLQTRASGAVTYGMIPEGSWGTGLLNWLEQWPEIDNQDNYDSQYSVIDNSLTENGYDPDNRWDGKRPASIRWSQIKSTGSEKDNYRIFKPIDVVDLDTNEGEIVEMETVNGNLYTLQPNAFTRHFVGDSQMQVTDQGTEIVLGSGGVLSNKGQKLSSFGATKKTSVTKGKTFSGDENLYWYNSETKKIVRFGGDGTRVLSDKGMMSFLMSNTTWHTDLLNPISGKGVTAGYNQRFYEAYFCFKAPDPTIQEFQTWVDTTYITLVQYPLNSLVVVSHQGNGLDFNYYSYFQTAARHISGLPYIYRKKNTALDTVNTRPGLGVNWTNNWDQLSPDTHPQYYRLFTLVYDEVKNGFICFHSAWPNIMATRTNTIYTSKPNEQNKIYVHNSGNYNTFYDVQYNGHIEGVVNLDPNMSKIFEAVQVVTDTTPDRIDFATRDHVSFLTSAEFEELEDFYYAPVKNDSTGTGVNSNDTSRLWGRYLKVKLRFAPSLFQKLINYVVKYRVNSRLYNR